MSDKTVDDVIAALAGTCESLDAVAEEILGRPLTDDECLKLDYQIFQCDCCGWWCDISEMSQDAWTCRDCDPDPED